MDGGSPDIDRQTKINEVHVSVGDAGAAGKTVETERVDFIEVAHVAVGDDADAAEASVDVGLDFAEVGAHARRLIEVLHHHHARLGKFQDARPEIVPRRRPSARTMTPISGNRQRTADDRKPWLRGRRSNNSMAFDTVGVLSFRKAPS